MILPDKLQSHWFSSILKTLTAKLKDNQAVHAMWLEGSVAQGRGDDMSDIDLWISVDDRKHREIIDIIKGTLEKIGELDIDFEMNQPHPQLSHQVFHFKNDSEFHTIDINLQDVSRKIKLQEGIDDHLTLFDKDNVIISEPVSSAKFSAEDTKRDAQQTFLLQAPNVKKNLLRGKKLEALIYYNYLVKLVVEMERKKVTPLKQEYGFKHIYQDLKADFVQFIEEIALSNAEDSEDSLIKIEKYINDY